VLTRGEDITGPPSGEQMPANTGSPSPYASPVYASRLRATRGAPSILRFALRSLSHHPPPIAAATGGGENTGAPLPELPSAVFLRVTLYPRSPVPLGVQRAPPLPTPHSPIAIRGLREA
jgi:hypothetical protein